MSITTTQVKHVADLANIHISETEAAELTEAFSETLEVIANLQSVDTSKTALTHQVTGLENVLREDVVDTDHMLSQTEALANAPQTHEGYIVVPRIIDQD